MRLSAAICGVVILLLSGDYPWLIRHGATQQKTPTPEQQERQQKWRDYMAKRHELQAHAKQVFDTEMAREKAGACTNATSTYDINGCFGKELETTDTNLKSYEGIIRDLIISVPGALEGPAAAAAPAAGAAGSSQAPAQSAAEFDHVNQAWEQYRDTACATAFHYFDGGTGGPSFEMQCRLTLDRNHMRELSLIYGGDLRL